MTGQVDAGGTAATQRVRVVIPAAVRRWAVTQAAERLWLRLRAGATPSDAALAEGKHAPVTQATATRGRRAAGM